MNDDEFKAMTEILTYMNSKKECHSLGSSTFGIGEVAMLLNYELKSRAKTASATGRPWSGYEFGQ